MSKTMDNDNNQDSYITSLLMTIQNIEKDARMFSRQVSEKDAEIERLKAQHSEFCKTMDWMQTELAKERRRNQFPDSALRTEQERNQLRARVEALESIERISDAKTIERLKADLNLAVAMYDKSRARVEEWEAQHNQAVKFLNQTINERDELRCQLEDARDVMNEWKGKYENMLVCKDELRTTLKRTCLEREELRTRLTESEKADDDWQTMNAASYQREADLRTQLKQASDRRDHFMHAHDDLAVENDELKSRLAGYEKPAPTIVKQTWSVVYSEPFTFSDKLIAKLRRDHYSDGSVKCELESV